LDTLLYDEIDMIKDLFTPLVESRLPTIYGEFSVKAYKSEVEQFPHLALIAENFDNTKVVDIRIHSECMTGDVFNSTKCDCGEQLDYSMQWVQRHGGLVLYLRQEGRGIGLVNKLKAYNLQDDGFNTREANLELGLHADDRSYDEAILMLEDLGIKRIRLLTNNPEKVKAFKGTSIELVDRLPIEIKPRPENIDYFKTKKDEMGHLFSNSKSIGL